MFLNAMGCSYYYEMRQCNTDPEEDNYADYVDLPDNRDALHVGDLAFGGQSTAVYVKMEPDFMTSQQENIEFLLDRYDVSDTCNILRARYHASFKLAYCTSFCNKCQSSRMHVCGFSPAKRQRSCASKFIIYIVYV